jgi:hypothetical protein
MLDLMPLQNDVLRMHILSMNQSVSPVSARNIGSNRTKLKKIQYG